MGFFANMAAKGEIRNREMMFEAFEMIGSDLVLHAVLLPCHIIDETHNGFSVSNPKAIMGVYRCQGYWWGRELSQQDLIDLRSPNPQQVLARLEKETPMRLAPFPGSGAVPTAGGIDYAMGNIR
jgi:hypothetical protein